MSQRVPGAETWSWGFSSSRGRCLPSSRRRTGQTRGRGWNEVWLSFVWPHPSLKIHTHTQCNPLFLLKPTFLHLQVLGLVWNEEQWPLDGSWVKIGGVGLGCWLARAGARVIELRFCWYCFQVLLLRSMLSLGLLPSPHLKLSRRASLQALAGLLRSVLGSVRGLGWVT